MKGKRFLKKADQARPASSAPVVFVENVGQKFIIKFPYS